MEIIDSHQHFWKYQAEQYPWITEGMEVLKRDYLPTDLQPLMRESGVTATIAVEARASVAETEALVRFAESHPFVLGVVGWLPLTQPDLAPLLEQLGSRLCGVRHAIGAEPNPSEYCALPEFNRGLRQLGSLGLTYDLSLWPPHLSLATELVDRHPTVRFVLDHGAKPFIARGEFEPWARELRALSLRPNVFCKLSGLATEADAREWRSQAPRYVEHVLEVFSPQRVLFGSDWPVCTLATSYGQWFAAVRGWVEPLSQEEQARILAGTAREAYGLEARGESFARRGQGG